MTPRISVVIPTYNRARDLKRALDSVVAQTFSDFEVLVVDNRSTDETNAVVASYADSRIALHLVSNEGVVARSRNLGISLARGEFIAFLDSDDWWTPRKLEASMAALSMGADVVYHHLYLVTRDNQRLHLRRVRAYDLRQPVFRDLLLTGHALPQSSVVMRRSLLVDIGGMPEDRDIIALEDYVCWLNAAKATDRFARVPGTHGYYWAGGGNLSNDKRVLQLLDRLEARYASDFNNDGRAQLPAWVSYARGRAHYRSGAYRTALHHLGLVTFPTAPLTLSMKSFATRSMIALSRRADAAR